MRDPGNEVVATYVTRDTYFYLLPIKTITSIYLGRVRLGYSGIRIYSGIYSGYSAPRSRIAGMEIQVFRNKNSSETNAYSHYSNYSYSRLIPNERALSQFNEHFMQQLMHE